MEFLWQKDDAEGDALYLDLYANIENDFPEVMLYDLSSMSANVAENTIAKSNAFSDHRRLDGNEKFKEKKWNEALKAYNECLCLAEIDTPNVAFAYGNRSACFLELKMYGKCLNDIELALKEKCPEQLKLRLETRKAVCLESLPTEVVPVKFAVKLSYEADKNFPGMANVLEIRKNDEFGRHVIAKCDIPAGHTVVLEENFISYTKPNNYLSKSSGPIKCITCQKTASNPIPCQKCTVVMFCGTDCRDGDKVHQMDCGAVYHWVGSNNKYIIQSVLAAVSMFPTVDELMDFVADAVASEQFEIPNSILDERSKYRMFLKLWQPPKMDNFIQETYKFFMTIMRFTEIKKLFDSTEKQRFLMHMTAHHGMILLFNSMEGQMGIISPLFSHSCAPNIQEMWIDSRTACMTIRPIKKGEQLCLSYMSEEVLKANNLDHKTEIYSKFGFRCRCVKCEDKLADLKRIERDHCFQQINKTNIDPKNIVLLQDFITKCTKCLNKYGHLPWSIQLEYVSKRLGFSMGLFYYTVEVA